MSEPSQPTRAEWRPQRFGRLDGRKVVDPLIEPVWAGERVLAHVEAIGPESVTREPSVAIRDEAGEPVEDFPEVAAAIGAAARATSLVIDGYLTDRVESGPVRALFSSVVLPTAGDRARQMMLGGGRRREGLEAIDRAVPVDPAKPTTFVAVDLLMVDGEDLLDVPLLERKRLLESVLDENHRVRLGLYVRPPLASWLASWRSVGFQMIAFKAANGRYQPGRNNDGWAISKIPLR